METLWCVGVTSGGIALVVALLSTPGFRCLGLRWGACDDPGEEKIHRQRISLLGGGAIFAGWLLSVTVIAAVVGLEPSLLLFVVFGGLIAMALGLWDDLLWKNDPTRYKSLVKLTCQIGVALALALLLYASGIRLSYVTHLAIQLPLLTLFAFGGMNAVNMTDGMDGMAATMVAISAIGFALIGTLCGDRTLLMFGAALSGATVGFLVYNRPPASIFMGDSGSHFLGFGVAVLAVMATRHSVGLRAFIGPILVLGIPVADAGLAVLRRLIQRSPLFAPDRGHVYDVLLSAGLSEASVLLVLGLVQVGLVVAGVLIVV